MVVCRAGLMQGSPEAGKSWCLVLDRPVAPTLPRAPLSPLTCCTSWDLMSVEAFLVYVGGCRVEKLLLLKGSFCIPFSSLQQKPAEAGGLAGSLILSRLLARQSSAGSELWKVLEEKAAVLSADIVTIGKVQFRVVSTVMGLCRSGEQDVGLSGWWLSWASKLSQWASVEVGLDSPSWLWSLLSKNLGVCSIWSY